MSNHDDNTARAMAFGDYHADTTGEGQIAEDLKAVLKLIAAQIEDSDRRHGQVLQEMQARLSELSTTTHNTRAKVPAAYAAAFERIQDGIAQLVERLSDPGAQAPAMVAPPLEPIAPPHTHPVADDLASNASEASAVTDQSTGLATVADEVAAGIDNTQDAQSETTPRQAASFDPDEPWDAHAAEALTRIIESDEGRPSPSLIAAVAGRALTSTSAIAMYAAESPEASLDHTAAPVAPRADVAPAAAQDADRAWLEARFCEIAAKIEASLEEMRRDEALIALNDRFGEFEDRLGSALEDVATRSDIEGLKLAEDQIALLVQQFERAQTQLSRLDGVEAQLEVLIDRLSDDRLFAFMGDRGPSTADIEAVARAAAEGAVMQLADSGLAGEAGSTAELREAIETFMAERRQSDEASTGMLETMQQAMLSVLDRLEQLEGSGFSVEAADYHDAGTDEAEAAAGPVTQHRNPGPVGAQMPAHPPADARTGQVPAQVPGLDEAASYVDAPAYGSAGRLGERNYSSAAQAVARPAVEPAHSEPQEDATNLSAIERLRREFIADAQKAKERAIEEQDRELANPKPAPRRSLPGLSLPGLSLPGLGGAKKVAEPVAAQEGPAIEEQIQENRRVPIQGMPAGKGKGSLFGIPHRKLLIGAIVVLLATAGTLMLMRGKVRKAPPPQATIERQIEERATAPDAAEPRQAAPEAPAAEQGDNPFEPKRSGLGDRSDVIEGGHDYGAPDDERRDVVEGPGAPSGIAVAESAHPLSPNQLAKLRERQSMARMSSELGAAAAYATPASLLPELQTLAGTGETSVNGVLQDQRQSVGSFGGNQLQLPPATVGPLSLRLAAAKGDASAQFEVGARLAEGKGTDQSFKSAVEWYQRSAAQGFAQSQYRLGTFYERGLGVKKDNERAQHWYQRAAESGNVKAMHNLAVLSAGSATGSPDYPTAAHWFTAAADRGLADSQFNLGVLYENGLGLPKDLKLAYKYYSLAARSGDAESIKRRDSLKADLAVTDLAAAETMVGIWRAQPTEKIANDPRVAGEDWKKRADNSYGG